MEIGSGLLRASLAAVLALAAPAAAAETPKYGGTLTYMIPADSPPSFDGHREATYATVHSAAPYYSVLIRVDPNNPGSATDFVCDLCTEIPQPSDDGKTYTFKIRDGVKFHDGSPLTAYDVAASWNKIVDPPEGVTSARQSFYVMVDKIETPDPMTVVFRLKFPTSAFLPALADPYTWIYKKEILDKEVVTQFEIARLDRVAVRSHRAHMLTAKQHATEGGAPHRTERAEYAQATTAGKASTRGD